MTSDDELNQHRLFSLSNFLKERKLSIDSFDL